ncbi:MAG: histidine phosphatase family protein [Lentisphaerae bacterium]|nr:histidine phosphatase family protein [Lentisphaerota bacterium]
MDKNICEFLVVRHGQTTANLSGILQGQMDWPLDEQGLEQARALAERLRNQHFDAAWCSDLSRTVVTAQAIMKYHPELAINHTAELREWHLGELQGKSFEELRNFYPNMLNAFKIDGPVPEIPGGENSGEFQERISTFMEKTAADNLGKRLLIITHGGVMQRMFRHTVGPINSTNIKPLCGNASISTFQKRPGGWQLISWNDTAHLENLAQHATLTF